MKCCCTKMFACDLQLLVILMTILQIEVSPKEFQNYSAFDNALCYSECFTQQSTGCDQKVDCNCSNPSQKIKWEDANTTNLSAPKLFCLEAEIIALQWDDKYDLTYFLEVQRDNSSWEVHETYTKCNRIVLRNLNPGQEYIFRLWGVSTEGEIYGPSPETAFETTSSNGIPLPVSEILFKEFILRKEHMDARVQWEPEDFSCFYEIVWYGKSNTDIMTQEILDVPNSFEYLITDMVFSHNYTVQIKSLNKIKGKAPVESSKKYLNLNIPSCVQMHSNLTICEPDVPRNFSATEEFEYEDEENNQFFTINVTWATPKIKPDYFVVTLTTPLISNETVQILGNNTNLMFHNILLATYYELFIKAYSAAGFSPAATFLKMVTTTNEKPKMFIFIYVGVIFTFILMIVAVLLMRKRNIKLNLRKLSSIYMEGITMKSLQSLDELENITEMDYCTSDFDEWTLTPAKLVIEEVLGEGAFGVVRKGYLIDDKEERMDVAVKMLKDSKTADEIRQFQHEIYIMKFVGSHPNIVSMIGCVTKSVRKDPLLVVEYCAKGDLLTFLRNEWTKLCNLGQEPREYVNYFGKNAGTCGDQVFNKLYEMNDLENYIQPKDILSFARQISMGMEHLSNMKVLHRDLAARNVLLFDNFTAKLSDFGLSRDVYLDNIYCKTGSGKLPIRWMAMESLMHQRYTTDSDIWSFGVLLWELVTLGEHPYPGIDTHELVKFLKQGHRMECPPNCSSELYTIMLSCWQENPKDRPSFTDIRIKLDAFLEDVSLYINICK